MAETKGTGIRAMRRLLEQAHLALPTFDSDRAANTFTTRLLLHHFLSEEDLNWLVAFDGFELNDNQKRGLIMLREIGAIDNSSYRQQAGVDTLTASQDLRAMRDMNLLKMLGKGSATYYVPGPLFKLRDGSSPGHMPVEDGISTTTPPPGLNTPPRGLNTPPPNLIPPPRGGMLSSAKAPQLPTTEQKRADLLQVLPTGLQERLGSVGKRTPNKALLELLITDICKTRPFTKEELALLFRKSEHYFRTEYINPMVTNGRLLYLHPEVLNHPEQAYVAP